MKPKIENRVRAGYATVFLLLLLSYISFFISTSQLKDHTDVLRHTNLVINKLETVISFIKDAETGVRGYVAVKDERFLEPYEKSFEQLEPVLRDLQTMFSDDAKQQKRLDKVKVRIYEKYRLLDTAVARYKNNGMVMSDTLKAMAYRGRVVMDSLRVQIQIMEDEENKFLMGSSQNIYGILKTTDIIIVTSMIIAALLVFYSLFTYNKENKAKKISDRRALAYRHEIEERIEELNKANKELMELKSIEKFAATGRIARTIAHEIRNPLTNIGLASEQLQSDLAGNEEHSIFFNMIDRNAKRINQLITDLLNSTKFAQLQFEVVNINDILDETLEDAKDRLELKSIELVRDYAKDIGTVSVDREKIKIAFLNIIVNAIEAMETGVGVLTIRSESLKGKCTVSFADNGTGINNDALGKLFEPYFTGKLRGTGLGLTHTQNIILNHQGGIQVESEPGRGTVFLITLNFAGVAINTI